jgi:hypothetical protein
MRLFRKNILPQRRKGAKIFFVSLCLCSITFISCSKKEEKIPEGIIPKDTMVQVMVDVHLAEARSQFSTPFDNSKNAKQSYYKFIFKKYNLTYQQLIKSWEFYAAHPDIFSKVYEDVITELSKKQAEENDIKKPK